VETSGVRRRRRERGDKQSLGWKADAVNTSVITFGDIFALVSILRVLLRVTTRTYNPPTVFK
jgi:hypothetical protein